MTVKTTGAIDQENIYRIIPTPAYTEWVERRVGKTNNKRVIQELQGLGETMCPVNEFKKITVPTI
jgi:hypothetical protein